jgi:hypothetical protein
MAVQSYRILAAFSVSYSCTQSIGLPWTEDQPVVRPLPTRRPTQTQNERTHIHGLSGIRTHDPSVRANEDSSCLRSRGHCDRHFLGIPYLNKKIILTRHYTLIVL